MCILDNMDESKSIMLNDIRQTEKDKQCLLSLICENWKTERTLVQTWQNIKRLIDTEKNKPLQQGGLASWVGEIGERG